MRSSVLLLGTVGLFVISGCSISTTDNSITFKSKKEFVDNSVPAKTSTQVWNGEPITITSDSVGFLNGNGGVYVRLDPNATQITAQSSFTARADDDSKREDANQSIDPTSDRSFRR